MQKPIFIRLTDFLARQEIPIHHPSDKVLLQKTFFSFFINIVNYIPRSELTTLLNGVKPSGSYEVEFDATGLSSGIYYDFALECCAKYIEELLGKLVTVVDKYENETKEKQK